MTSPSTPEQIEARWLDLEYVAKHYQDFVDFYTDISIELLGFIPTAQQKDIARYIAYGPQLLLAEAQRGEAKTTIAGCYGVWSLLQNPRTRVVILSAGTSLAKQIATWCIQIINHMDILEPLRPDPTNPGTRTSVEAFDVHHDLKGAEKSPSIACLGITSTMQGYRADVLIADDVESSKNSLTSLMREQLRHKTRDFPSICSDGRIIYLGTPQTNDSIYNDLPARGFGVRIWPGRYPTAAKVGNYGAYLAPMIRTALEADPGLGTGGGLFGDRGAPTDTNMMAEAALTKKEQDQGASYFDLQYMLDTELTDSDRYPLKLRHLMFYSFDQQDAPSKFVWSNNQSCIVPCAVGHPIQEPIYKPASVSAEFLPYSYRLLAVDPAGGGQNGDETGVTALFGVNGYLIAMEVTGVAGGVDPGKLLEIVKIAQKWDIHNVIVEQNFGHGAWTAALKAAFQQADYPATIGEVLNKGQKELRIIDSLEPVIGSHRLLINQDVLDDDVRSIAKYPMDHRMHYSFLYQLKNVTRARGSLIKDDRIDSLSIAVTELLRVMQQHKQADDIKKTQRFMGFVQNKVGKWMFPHRVAQESSQALPSVMDRYKRR